MKIKKGMADPIYSTVLGMYSMTIFSWGTYLHMVKADFYL